MAHTTIFSDRAFGHVGKGYLWNKEIPTLPICPTHSFKCRFHSGLSWLWFAAYEKLLSHKTANPFTTNEPQSCVFCEGGKTFLYKIHPVSLNRSIPARLSGMKKSPFLSERALFHGDPYGNRTHVTAVKGRCLNRLTIGPSAFPIGKTVVAVVGVEPTTLRV